MTSPNAHSLRTLEDITRDLINEMSDETIGDVFTKHTGRTYEDLKPAVVEELVPDAQPVITADGASAFTLGVTVGYLLAQED
jgi:hypothetical protein